MLTLTLADNVDDTRITEFWNRLKASLRKYGIKFEYMWTKEFTTKGKRHLHVLLDKFIKKSLIRRLWRYATENTSYIVKINHRPIRSAAGYISKYLTKGLLNEHRYKRKERRYSFSRGFNLPKEPSTGEWAFELDYGQFEEAHRGAFKDAVLELHRTMIRYRDLTRVKRQAEEVS